MYGQHFAQAIRLRFSTSRAFVAIHDVHGWLCCCLGRLLPGLPRHEQAGVVEVHFVRPERLSFLGLAMTWNQIVRPELRSTVHSTNSPVDQNQTRASAYRIVTPRQNERFLLAMRERAVLHGSSDDCCFAQPR